MDIAALKIWIADVPAICQAVGDDGKPIKEPYKRSEIVPKEVLCSEGEFAAFELESGKFAAIWTGHVDVAEDKDELVGLLNKHEQALLAYGVNK